MKLDIENINIIDTEKVNYIPTKCYIPSNNKCSKIIHLILTRFIMEFDYLLSFRKQIYQKKYYKWD